MFQPNWVYIIPICSSEAAVEDRRRSKGLLYTYPNFKWLHSSEMKSFIPFPAFRRQITVPGSIVVLWRWKVNASVIGVHLELSEASLLQEWMRIYIYPTGNLAVIKYDRFIPTISNESQGPCLYRRRRNGCKNNRCDGWLVPYNGWGAPSARNTMVGLKKGYYGAPPYRSTPRNDRGIPQCHTLAAHISGVTGLVNTRSFTRPMPLEYHFGCWHRSFHC